jgi:hypothetical protein
MCTRLLKPTKDLLVGLLHTCLVHKRRPCKCKVTLALTTIMIYLCVQASHNVHLVLDKWVRPYLSV